MVKQMLLKVLLLTVVVSILFFGLIYFSPFKQWDEENDFAAAIIDKQAMLHQAPSPKIVVVGGSSVAYGIDTKLMQDSLKRPVINMAFQYFLGSKFLIKQVEEALKPGDILITSFEYIASADGDMTEQARAASYYPHAWQWVDDTNPLEPVSAWLRYQVINFKGIINRILQPDVTRLAKVEDTENVFFRGAINENGDLISQLNNPQEPFDKCHYGESKVFLPIFDALDETTDELGKRKVTVYFLYPSYSQSSFDEDEKYLDVLHQYALQKKHLNILGTPKQSAYADSLFQDMCFHLNAQGRRIRTEQLIQLLKRQGI